MHGHVFLMLNRFCFIHTAFEQPKFHELGTSWLLICIKHRIFSHCYDKFGQVFSLYFINITKKNLD